MDEKATITAAALGSSANDSCTFTANIASLKADLEKSRNDALHWEKCAAMESQTRRLAEKNLEEINLQKMTLQEEYDQLQRKFRKLMSITNSLKTRLALSNTAVGQLKSFSHKFGAMIKFPLHIPQ